MCSVRFDLREMEERGTSYASYERTYLAMQNPPEQVRCVSRHIVHLQKEALVYFKAPNWLNLAESLTRMQSTNSASTTSRRGSKHSPSDPLKVHMS